MNRPPRGAASIRGGFTLIEVAVVITMIGVLVAVAAVFIKPSSAAASARGYADQVAALCDAARQRAVATRRIQVIEVDTGRVAHKQAARTGLEPPREGEELQPVGLLPVPGNVSIASLAAATHDDPDRDIPPVGTGLPGAILFMPDGTSQAATIFIQDSRSENRARVAIYPATGAAYAYHEW